MPHILIVDDAPRHGPPGGAWDDLGAGEESRPPLRSTTATTTTGGPWERRIMTSYYYYTVDQAAKALHVPMDRVCELAAELKCSKVGRHWVIEKADLARMRIRISEPRTKTE